MDSVSEVLVEAQRLQMLGFIGRAKRGKPTSTPGDAARWLRIPVAECSLLVAELTDEGFVGWGRSDSGPLSAPLRLTSLGRGMLEWTRRHAEDSDSPPGRRD